MKKIYIRLISLSILLAVAAVACAAPEASAPIEAIPLELEETTEEAVSDVAEEIADEPTEEEPTEVPVEEAVPTEVPVEEAEPTEVPVEEAAPTEVPVEEAEPTEVPVEEAAPTEIPAEEAAPTSVPVEEAAPTGVPAEETTNNAGDGSGVVIYEIDQEQSQVRFELDEDLRGERITVVGVTNQVAGQLALNFDNLEATQIGILQINARTLATDNNNRNRAINNFVLNTSTYEFITFEPIAINELTGSVAIGGSADFQIVGNLTIRDITQEVTFDITATADSETELSGSASAIISLEAFDLAIPSVPAVANVEEEVELYIDFVALATP